jgi:hypothetical protein
MRTSARTAVIVRTLVAATLLSATAVAQDAVVRITGARSIAVDAADLAAMPRTTLKVASRGQDSIYEGVSIRELLTLAGVPAGGANLTQVIVVVTGADGDQVDFRVLQIDPAFTSRVAVLADRRNGAPLAANEGPFQLVLSEDERGGRWMRHVVSIDVRRAGQ